MYVLYSIHSSTRTLLSCGGTVLDAMRHISHVSIRHEEERQRSVGVMAGATYIICTVIIYVFPLHIRSTMRT